MQTGQSTALSRGDIATFIYLALSWGSSFSVVLQSIAAFGWLGATAFRCFLAGITIIVIARLAGRRLSFSGNWRPIIIVGIFSVAMQLIGLTYATPVIGSAMTAIMIPTIPLYSMLISQAWGIERMSARGLAGLALGVAGIVMLVGFPSVAITPAFLFGCFSALAGTFGAAFGSVYASRTVKDAGTLELTAGSFLVGGLITLPLLVFQPIQAVPPLSGFLWLAVSGCVMSALNYVLYFRLVSRIGATRAVSVEFIVTVIAVIIGTVLLDERLSLIQMIGGAAVIAGCMTILGLIRLPTGRKAA